MTVTDDTTGEQLTERLLQGGGNEQMRAATRLLGAHRNGYWLRRFLQEEREFTAAGERAPIDRSGAHPSIDWTTLGLLLLDSPWVFPCSDSELAVLKFAVSLVGRCGVQLQGVIQALDDAEFRLAVRALQEAAYGETC